MVSAFLLIPRGRTPSHEKELLVCKHFAHEYKRKWRFIHNWVAHLLVICKDFVNFARTSQDWHDDTSYRYTGRPNHTCNFDTSL